MSDDPRPGKRNAIRAQNETLILQAAEKVFAEAGFGGATMQLIADVAGLPKANLHYYFATKEELYRRVVQNIFEKNGLNDIVKLLKLNSAPGVSTFVAICAPIILAVIYH